MKNIPAPVISYLNTAKEINEIDLISFSLLNGTVLRYAIYDQDITYNGHTYKTGSSLFSLGQVSSSIGTSVDELDLDIYPSSVDLVNGISFLQAVVGGLFDGATCTLERAFMQFPPVVLGGFLDFYGNVSECDPGRSYIKMAVKSPLELLNIQLPRNLYQPPCSYNVYDTDTCVISADDFTFTGAITSTSTKSVLHSGLSQPDGYYDLGYILFTSGTLNGSTVTVQSYAGGIFNVIPPLIIAPTNGTTFKATAGCDHTSPTCDEKFDNLGRFHGFPDIPAPETVT